MGEIEIDGVLDEEAWKEATRIGVPYEWFPGDNIAAPVHTEFLVTYNETHVFLAWRFRVQRNSLLRDPLHRLGLQAGREI